MATLTDMMDLMKEKSANGLRSVSNALKPAVQAAEPVIQQAGQSLRGAASAIGDTAKAVWTSPLGQATRNLGGATIERAGAAMSDLERYATEKMNAKAGELRAESKPTLRSANVGTNPNVRPGGMSAEAQAFRSGGSGTPPPTTTEPGAGSPKRGFFGKVGRAFGMGLRGAGAVTAGFGVKEGYDALSRSPTAEEIRTGTEPSLGDATDKTLFGGMMAAKHPALQAGGAVGLTLAPLRDAAIKYAVENFLQPTRNPNIYNDQLHRMVDGQQFIGKREAPAASVGATAPVAPIPAAAPVAPQGMTPEQIIKNRGVNPGGKGIIPEGTGAIKVGNNPASAISNGARSDTVKPGTQDGQGLRIQAKTPMGVIAESLMHVKAAQARESGKAAEANLGIKSLTARTTAAKTGAELRKAADDSFDKEIDNQVMRGIDEKLPKEERDALFSKRSADYKARVKHTLGDSGQELVDMDGAQKQKLHVANKFREKLVESRKESLQQLRDYAGQKRFDSENLYSYMPERVVRTATGYQIHTKNGNTMDVSSAAGGGFVLLGPNLPIDADMMAEIVAAAKRQSKGK